MTNTTPGTDPPVSKTAKAKDLIEKIFNIIATIGGVVGFLAYIIDVHKIITENSIVYTISRKYDLAIPKIFTLSKDGVKYKSITSMNISMKNNSNLQINSFNTSIPITISFPESCQIINSKMLIGQDGDKLETNQKFLSFNKNIIYYSPDIINPKESLEMSLLVANCNKNEPYVRIKSIVKDEKRGYENYQAKQSKISILSAIIGLTFSIIMILISHLKRNDKRMRYAIVLAVVSVIPLVSYIYLDVF